MQDFRALIQIFWLFKHSQKVACKVFFFLIYLLFIYFWLRWVFVAAYSLSLVAVSGGHFLAVVRELLVAAASLAAEHAL